MLETARTYEKFNPPTIGLKSNAKSCHVRFGSKADMCGAIDHVRFTPESDIKRDTMECPR